MRIPACALILVLIVCALGCSDTGGSISSETTAAAEPMDRPLAAWRHELLAVAQRVASAFPLNPHAKNRSRNQNVVAQAWIELDQLGRAGQLADDIVGWERGLVWARIAKGLTARGRSADAVDYIRRAEKVIAQLDADENEQAWRKEAILAAVAAAERSTSTSEDAEPIKTAEQLDAFAASLDDLFDKTDFDTARVTLERCASLYRRFITDDDRRATLERQVRSGYEKLPMLVRVDLLMSLTRHCLESGRLADARRLEADTRKLVAAQRWLVADQVRLAVRLAALRDSAGDAAEAKADFGRAITYWRREKAMVVDINRAEVLCAVAESAVAMKDEVAASSFYAEALTEALVNPNSRPRADDIVLICVSMATRSLLKPSPELMSRLHEAQARLGSPW